MYSRRLLLGIAAAFAVLVVAFGGAGSVVRADGGGSISGTVYFDTDLDGRRDRGEPPAEGITVRLHRAEGGDAGTTQSGSGGSYRFDNLKEQGNYEIMATSNGCSSSAYYSNYPGSDGPSEVFDLGLPPPGDGRVSGVLWNDLDEDGIRDAGEPGLADWYIYLRFSPTRSECRCSAVSTLALAPTGNSRSTASPLCRTCLTSRLPPPRSTIRLCGR